MTFIPRYLAVLCGLLVALPTLASQEARQTDIVVILADDIGTGDISFYNERIANKEAVVKTTNIDALAASGVWFTDAHSATALCAPTRYAVMTGFNNYRSYAPWGVWGSFQPNAISIEDPTLARVTKAAGYRTAFVGKWHLGGDFLLSDKSSIYRGSDKGNLPNVDLMTMVGGGPNDLGFDYSFMLPDGIQGPLYLAYENQQWSPLSTTSVIRHLNSQSVSDTRTISDKGDGMGDSGWDTRKMGDILSAKAAEFIHRQPVDEPLFLYYASPMAHLPHMPPDTFDNEKVAGRFPSDHLAMIYELDLQVGRIMDALKTSGRYNDTLIIFTSDNGGLTYRVPGTLESGHRPSGSYRGSKNSPYEGGHRVPFIVSWPNRINKPLRLNKPVMVQDILSTVAAAAGKPVDREIAPDSVNMLPLFTKSGQSAFRDYLMLQGGSGNELIYREGDWKLIIQSNHAVSLFEPVGLFNLAENITEDESKNLIGDAEQQQRIARMATRYKYIRESGQATHLQ